MVHLVALALAEEPAHPVEAVASRDVLTVDMPAVHVRARPGASSPWWRLGDGMAAELALAGAGISVDDASVVSVERGDGHTRIDWTELATGDVRLRVDAGSSPTVCTSTVRGGIWSGTGSVEVYAPSPGRASEDLGFLLVEDHPVIGALVALAPGDSVTVTNVRKDGELLHEWVEVRRPTGTVSVDRKPAGERICTTRAPKP